MLSRTCSVSVNHFLHPSQLFCKDCGADSVIRDHYVCQRCGWNTWNPRDQASCPCCGSAIIDSALGLSDRLIR